jgi:hypothetical protein
MKHCQSTKPKQQKEKPCTHKNKNKHFQKKINKQKKQRCNVKELQTKVMKWMSTEITRNASNNNID